MAYTLAVSGWAAVATVLLRPGAHACAEAATVGDLLDEYPAHFLASYAPRDIIVVDGTLDEEIWKKVRLLESSRATPRFASVFQS